MGVDQCQHRTGQVFERPTRAVVLIAVHKALKCDEYQAECLRLSQAYQSIAIAADSACSGPDGERDSQQKILTSELVDLTKNAKAQVPTNFMHERKG